MPLDSFHAADINDRFRVVFNVYNTVYLCFRYSMLVEDGVVKKINVEPDGTGLTCSLASSILSDL